MCVGIVYFWFLETYGTFQFPSSFPDGRSSYLAAEALSILHGHWSVPPFYLAGLHGECLNYRNVCTGYYGIMPSLLRIPAVALVGDSRFITPLYLLASFATYLVAAFLVIRNLLSLKRPGSTLSARAQIGLGLLVVFSPVSFLAVRGYMYEEEILWGVAFLMATFAWLIKYLATFKSSDLWIGIAFGLATVQTRPPEGITAVIACVGISALYSRGARRIWFSAASTVSGLSLAVVNLSKFGVIVPSLQHHGGYLSNPIRLAFVTRCGDFNVGRIPSAVLLYLVPNFHGWPLNFAYTPDQYALHFANLTVTNSCTEWLEAFSPVSVTYPALTACAAFGVYVIVKAIFNRKILNYAWMGVFIAAGAIGIATVLSAAGETERYLGDFTPLLLILAFAGVVDAPERGMFVRRAMFWPLMAGQIFLAYASIFAFWSMFPDKPGSFANLLRFWF